MIFDPMIQEAIRIGEKMLAAESLRPAGHVFATSKNRSRLYKNSAKKRKYYRPAFGSKKTKLSALADMYRPKEEQ